jgi:integrase
MASIVRAGSGWRAFVAIGGIRKSKRFDGKAAASDWANKIERQLRDGDESSSATGRTLADAMERYERDVTPTKKGARWESIRLAKLLRDRKLVDVRLSKLSPADIAAWRDRRLKEVSSASVAREMNLIGTVLTQARKEWRWISASPITDVRRPKEPPPRERRITPKEIELIVLVTGYRADTAPKSVSARVGAAFLFAIETAMRLGEICGLRWRDVDFDSRVATLHDTKNGSKREVPLTIAAAGILGQLRELRGKEEFIFGLDPENTSALFRKWRLAAGIKDMTFHDTRHEAITRLSKKMDVLALARMVGHRDIRNLMIYYNESAADIAKGL